MGTRLTLLLAAAGLVAGGLAGCTSSHQTPTPNPAAPSSSTPTPAPTLAPTPAPPATSPDPTPSAAGSTAADQVAAVGLVTADLAPGLTASVIPGGTSVTTQPTLDACGYKYATESHRVARRQVEVLTAAGDDTGVSNEVVAYDSPAQAAKALGEYRLALTRCPKGKYVSLPAVEGAPPVRYLTVVLDKAADLPVADNAVARIHGEFKASPVVQGYSYVVMQVQGTILDAVYVNDTAPLSADAVNTGTELAQLTGQRLAGLPGFRQA